MTMKTPEQIAREELSRYIGNGDTTAAFSEADMLEFANVAIEADRAQRGEINEDWRDDQENVRGADHVEVAWIARDSRGRVIFQSDMVLSDAQAVGMFQGIGEASL